MRNIPQLIVNFDFGLIVTKIMVTISLADKITEVHTVTFVCRP